VKTSFSIVFGIVLTVVMMFSRIQMVDSIAKQYKSLLAKGQKYDFFIRGMTKDRQLELTEGIRNDEYGVGTYLILNESLS
jgi:hypothetical protein